MKYGNLMIRIGFGLLFIWGGLEKFFEGFLGGVGLQNMADFLKSIGWDFLGNQGTLILATALALLEIIAGVLLLANKQVVFSYGVLALIMLIALVTVYLPSGNWMNGMIHFALFTKLLGLGLTNYDIQKPLLQQK